MHSHSRRLLPSACCCAAACALAAVGLLAPSLTWAAPPLIAGLGGFAQVDNPGERPDPSLDYKVVMGAVHAGSKDEALPGFERLARLANLLAESGVAADRRHLVVIVYGPATPAVLTAEGRKAHGLEADPNAAAIAKLMAAGISVRACGQALAGWKISRSEVLPGVEVDLSALTTLATLQLKGYALLQD